MRMSGKDRIDTITAEIGGRESAHGRSEEAAISGGYIVRATDPAFNIELKPVREIDWSGNPKRLFFSSSVA